MADLVNARPRGGPRVLAALAWCILAFAATACGSEESEQPAGSEGSAAEAGSSVAAAQERVQAAMEPPVFEAPGGEFDMSQNAGKTVWFIAPAMSLPFVASIAEGFQEAAETAGMKAVVFDGKGNVTEWNKGVQQAVNQGADGIHLQAIDPALVSGPLEQAIDKGIVVIDGQNGDPDAPTPDGLFGHATFSFTDTSKRLADYIISQSNGAANVAMLTDPKFPALEIRRKAIEEQFAAECPDCTFSAEDVDVATIAQRVPQTVQTLLSREPDTTWIISAFDGMVSFIEQGLRDAGKEDVRVIGADAVAQNLEAIRDGNTMQEADVGPPLAWQGWGQVDLLGRALAGEEPLNAEIPTRFFTKENLEGTTAETFFGDTPFKDEYQALWGMGQ